MTVEQVDAAQFTQTHELPSSAAEAVEMASNNDVVSEKAVKGCAISHSFRYAVPFSQLVVPNLTSGKSRRARMIRTDCK